MVPRNSSISSVGSVRSASASTRDSTKTPSNSPTSVDNFRPIVRHKTLPDSPTSVGVGANYFRWGQLEYLRHCSISRCINAQRGICTTGIYTCIYVPSVSRGSVVRILPVLQVCFVFRYCRYMLACALGVRYCPYSVYSQYLGLLSTRNILAVSTPILSLRFLLEHLSVKPSSLSTKKALFWGHMYCMCCILLSRGHKVLQRNLDLTQLFCTSVCVAYIELIAASHLFRIKIQYPITGTLFCLLCRVP